MRAIVLAGGLGTRLRDVLSPQTPKALAPVAGRPFLFWLLEHLSGGGVDRVLISVGWRAEAITELLGGWRDAPLAIDFCIETSPLGTGGALRYALGTIGDPDVLVVNGDSLAEVDYRALAAAHRARGGPITLSCLELADTGRYGRVRVEDGRIAAFEEKAGSGPGTINAGVYAVSRSLLPWLPEAAHSLERDVLAAHTAAIAPGAYCTHGAFIDIGVPEDLVRAQTVIPDMLGRS